MVTKRPISWFLTETGRRFSFGVVTTVGIGVAVAKFTPNTILLTKYKSFVHYYSNGQPASLTKELEEKVNKCLDILNFSVNHRKLIEPFNVYGFDLFNAGCTKSKFGVAIGLPINFTYKSLADFENAGIQVNQKKVDWSSESGKKLADAIVLPDKVQEFAICREILATHNSKLFIETAYPLASIIFTYTLSQAMNQRLNLYAGPVALRSILYTLTGLFGIGLYFLLKDYTEVYYETMVDKQLCNLGPDFIESGIIFYDKLLKRNQALRELMGPEGVRKYSVLGNENFFIRQPRISLVHRKQFFEKTLKEQKVENDENNN